MRVAVTSRTAPERRAHKDEKDAFSVGRVRDGIPEKSYSFLFRCIKWDKDFSGEKPMRFMGRKKANITLSGGESNKKSNRVWGRQVCPSEESGLEQITAAHFMRRKKGKKNSVQRKRPFFRAAAALQVFVLAGVLLFAAVALSGCGAKDKGSVNRYEIDAVFSERIYHEKE